MTVAIVAAALLMPATAGADEHEGGGANFSVTAGFDVTTAYFFRGLPQENQGYIVQPYVELGLQVTDNLSVNLGMWNSVHENATFASAAAGSGGADIEDWYEADIYAGFGYQISDRLATSVTWTNLTSPADAFAKINEVAVGFTYDDSGCWDEISEGLAMNPHVTVIQELQGQADLGTNEGLYLELGVGPQFNVSEDEGVTLTIPITVGVG
ncbi:MAG: hypothetical protein OER86_01365, partial [Phycisphaerae bacterium]|nr:hypothetical protein [Phycisphaerae bacterium]